MAFRSFTESFPAPLVLRQEPLRKVLTTFARQMIPHNTTANDSLGPL